jgi:hypothetical protein
MSKALATKNVAAVLLGIGMIVSAFAFATPANAQSTTELQAQINALLAQIQALQSSSSTGGSCTFTFTMNLKLGSKGAEVMNLQKFLNSMSDTRVAASGAGSPGNETSTFGPATRAAVIKFQNKYAADILTPSGLTKGTGNFFAASRAKANALCTTTGGNTGGNTGTTPGTLSVSAASQPANSLAPQGASRVPFTTFTLTNSSNAAVTVNGITVQRVGLGVDAVFSGISLVDSNSVQLGTTKTLNSNHQAVIGETFTINPGQSMTLTVAGNMAASLAAYAGQVVGIQVVGINTTATVSGSLPISGASHVMNATLSLGSVSTSTSAFDPGVNQNKSIGDTAVRFTGIRFTAGSAEDLKLYSIRWRQTGTVSASDLANVVSVVNGTTYPTTVSTDGKYYTTIFPGGLLISKGNSIDVHVQGDIVGSNVASRTVKFDIDRATDMYFVGQTYGYGIAPGSSSSPWFAGYTITIQGGTATTIAKANEVAAQNVAVNVSNQPLGGFATDFKGEAVSVQGITMTVATGTAATGLLQSVSIVDANGAVVAGPVDATWNSGTQTLTFTDTVTFPVGRAVYTVKGKVPTGAVTGATIAISSNPSNWTNPQGQTSGNTVSLSGNGSFTMNTMTVRGASMAVAVSATPAATNIVAGGQAVTFANYQFDASQSGEDIRFSGFTADSDLSNGGNAGALSNLSSCQIFDGNTALNGGSNIVNPSETATTTAGVNVAFTFDNQVVIAKGTVKTLALKCNVSASVAANTTFQFGIENTSTIAATGVTSGTSVTVTPTTQAGQVMTVSGGGAAVVSTDSSSPSYTIAAGSSANENVVLGTYKFRASNEAVTLNRIGLKLTNTASSSAADLVMVTLKTGGANGTTIGTATFVGSNAYATSTLSSPLNLPKDTDVVVTVVGDIASIGSSEPGTTGHLVAVDVDVNTNTQGVGAQSGNTVNVTGSTAVAGVRIFKSFPIIAKDSVPTNTASNGSQKTLLRFKVTANAAGDIGVGKVTLNVATTGVTVSSLNVYAFTDAGYATPVSGLRSDGALMANDVSAMAADIDVVASSPVQVTAGTTRYFAVMATVAGAADSGDTISTSLSGDAAYPSHAAGVFDDTLANIDADANDDFIWSPNTTGTAAVGDADWTNGFGVVGLPSAGLSAEVLSR